MFVIIYDYLQAKLRACRAVCIQCLMSGNYLLTTHPSLRSVERPTLSLRSIVCRRIMTMSSQQAADGAYDDGHVAHSI